MLHSNLRTWPLVICFKRGLEGVATEEPAVLTRSPGLWQHAQCGSPVIARCHGYPADFDLGNGFSVSLLGFTVSLRRGAAGHGLTLTSTGLRQATVLLQPAGAEQPASIALRARLNQNLQGALLSYNILLLTLGLSLWPALRGVLMLRGGSFCEQAEVMLPSILRRPE